MIKFKRVEISAFRIYDKPVDSTFDFTTNNGEIADFVSLYAPNGFGKTSFYDAVEWGMTKSINRFLIKRSENMHLSNVQNKESQQPLIRNSKSNKKLMTRVKIETNKKEKDIDRPWERHGKNKFELDFNKSPDIQNKSFHQVILSQDWISSFLSEEDGYERYNKFKGLPELRKTDEYYKNILALISECKDEKKKHLEAISQLKKKLTVIDDEQLLKKINQQGQKMNREFGYKFGNVDLSYTDNEIYSLKNEIATKILSDTNESRTQDELDLISIALGGNENISSVGRYHEEKANFKNAEGEIEEFEKNIRRFSTLEGKRQELTGLKERLNKLSNQREVARIIESRFAGYERSLARIKAKNIREKEISQKTEQLKTRLETEKQDLLKERNALEASFKEVNELEVRLDRLPEFIKRLAELEVRQSSIAEVIETGKLLVGHAENRLRDIDQQITQTVNILKKVKEGEQPQLTASQTAEIGPHIDRLKTSREKINQIQVVIDSLETQIEQQKELNTEIEEFINRGLELVNQSRTSNCPLCEQKYESYEILSKRIASNAALRNQLQSLLQSSNELKQDLPQIQALAESDLAVIEKSFNSIIGDLNKSKNVVKEELSQANTKLKDNTKHLADTVEEISKINIQIDGNTAERYESNLKEKISHAVAQRDDSIRAVEDRQKKIDQLTNELDGCQKQHELNNQETEDLTAGGEYQRVVTWFQENLTGREISKNSLISYIEILGKDIEAVIKEVSNIEKLISELTELVKSFSKERILEKLKEFKAQKESHQKKIEAYEYFVSSNLGLDIHKLKEDAIAQELEERSQKLRDSLTTKRTIKLELEKLAAYTENLKEFLQVQKIRSEIKESEDTRYFLQTKVEPLLLDEKKKTIKYLEDKVKEFFHIELITKLYNKIDPHPEFKKVSFKASFEEDNPRLDVFVTDDANKTKVIPNLYFSTAQINILSLSIFLASALNSKDYDCIFIDDPIQSMDSINMLSTIDLLRSISVNYKKQIILSTHDENFHKLLQRKIPSSIFKAKYLELETFGKVKASETIATG